MCLFVCLFCMEVSASFDQCSVAHGLRRLCTRDHKHTRLEGHWTTRSAAYPMAWCEEYARLLSWAPEFLKMLTTYHPVADTDTSYKHVSSVSMLRHWPEYPSYYLTGDLDTARERLSRSLPLWRIDLFHCSRKRATRSR